MTGRDRIVLIAISALAVLAAVWLLVVSPEREKATQLAAQVSAERAQLASTESHVASARAAQAEYAAAYASIVNLGKAVPPSEEVPSLIYELDQASNQKGVDLFSIVSGSGSGASPSANATPAPVAAVSGFTQLPFTFVFNGSFHDLSHLFEQLNRFTVRTASGTLRVSGRLLTIQSIKMAPSAGAGSGQLSGTVMATAYVLPASQGLTGEATPSSPTGAATPAASTAGASTSPSAPAIARVSP